MLYNIHKVVFGMKENDFIETVIEVSYASELLSSVEEDLKKEDPEGDSEQK